jgi:AAHS family 4-hydroxybenzoate transporter-like MFS transporter
MLLFFDGFDTQAMSYVLPELATAWHLPRSAFGAVLTSGMAGLTVGYLVIAPLSDRFGHRRMILTAGLVFSLLTLLTGFATHVTHVMILRFFAGVGLGGAVPSVIALVAEFGPKRLRARIVAFTVCGFSVGFIAAGMAAKVLLSDLGWRSMLWLGGALPLLFWIGTFLFVPDSLSFSSRKSDGPRRVAATIRTLFPDVEFPENARLLVEVGGPVRATVQKLFVDRRLVGTLLVWLIFFVSVAEVYFLQTWLPTILVAQKYSMDFVIGGTVISTAGGIVAVFVIGPLMDRVGTYTSLTILYVVGGLAMLFVGQAFTLPPWILLAALAVAGFCVNGGHKCMIALAALFYPVDIRSTGIGWALGFGRLGGVFGTFAVGLLYTMQASGAQMFYLASAPVFVVGFAIAFMGGRYGSTVSPAQIPAEN